MNAMLLKALQKAGAMGMKAGRKAVDVGRVAGEMASPTINKGIASAKSFGRKAENVAHYAGTKTAGAYRANPNAFKAGGLGIGAGAIAGSTYESGGSQDNLNTMFEEFDSVPAFTMSEPNVQQWIDSGADPEEARWLGMIDTVYESQEIIAKDEGLQRQFSSILDSLNVNYLDMDLEHHNQKRKKVGLEPLGYVPPDQELPDEDIKGGSSSKGVVFHV